MTSVIRTTSFSSYLTFAIGRGRREGCWIEKVRRRARLKLLFGQRLANLDEKRKEACFALTA